VVTETEIKGVHLGTNRERFEAKVRTYLRSHEDELAVQKLRRNRQLTTADLAWFENLFVEFGFGTREDVEEVATEHQGLGIFLRSLSGLDRTAAAAAYVATTPDAHPRAAPSADLGTGCALPRVRARGGTPVRGPT
jgi:type I restriction enzyme R subunit